MTVTTWILLCSMYLAGTSTTEQNESPNQPPGQSDTSHIEESLLEDIEQLVDQARHSVVVVYFTNREGVQDRVGTGFVVDSNGLIATNLHVIGEARPIRVRLADGRIFEAEAVHASDRTLDLALVRVDAKDLPSLTLGDSDSFKQGQEFIALGNPHGLARSAVHGVVSGIREIDDRPMIQLAMPVEPGNSGGPVLDRQGHVQGIVTLKSAIAQNLGFAVPINQLKALMAQPNPVPMSRWLTIGAIDLDTWQPLFGATWRQRAGRIIVDGRGQGFGGRSLLLSKQALPELPFELAVMVRLDHESGAAGLAFYSDGNQKHYGFYPSNGNVRLSRFDGPTVFQWNVLEEVEAAHYRPGDWNMLKIRLEKDHISCFVNDHLIIESADTGLTTGDIGLVKFRDTRAEFRQFAVADTLPTSHVPDHIVVQITKQLGDLPHNGELPRNFIDALVPFGAASQSVLEARIRSIEWESDQLRTLAVAVHRAQVLAELVDLLRGEKVDLFQAALLIAKMDNDEVDVEAYLHELDQMAHEILVRLPDGPGNVDDQTKIATLNQYLFQENGFHGSRMDYYHRSNSYLNEVLDDREGLPITLSVLYMELCDRIGLHVVGSALPGHFMVRHIPSDSDLRRSEDIRLIDVFEGGKAVTLEQARLKVRGITGMELASVHLKPASEQEIIIRMLHNLMAVAQQAHPHEGPLPYLDAILAIAPESAPERGLRAILRARIGRPRAALEDTQWLLEHQPAGIDLDRVRQLHETLVPD